MRAWTGRQVGEALVAAFVALPYAPIYAPATAASVPTPGPDGAPPFEALALAARHLGRDDRILVLTWARHKAARRLRLFARESGRDRRAERRRVAAALERLAAAWTAAGIAPPSPAPPAGSALPGQVSSSPQRSARTRV